jgi:hypothetical protein
MSISLEKLVPFADGIEIVEVFENEDGSINLTIDIPKQAVQDILSGFLKRALVNAAKEINPERPKTLKEKLIDRLESYLKDGSLCGEFPKGYAFALAEAINDLGGPDYDEVIEARFRPSA